MEKILLDTDIGGDIDDAICLAYLLKESKCDLLGITTVCGNPCARASIASVICESVSKNIPIVAGMDETLQPIDCYPTPEGEVVLRKYKYKKFKKGNAPLFLFEKIKENPNEVILIGIGNMTNIATMFKKYPESINLLKGLYTMNGYFGSEKLPEPFYNWNSWADPLASKIVFETRLNINRVIPLEVTDTLSINANEKEKIFNFSNPLIDTVLDFGGEWMKISGKVTLHDPLVAVSIFHPEIIKFCQGFVEVETNVKENMGGTKFIANARGNIEIATEVDKSAFYKILSETISK